MPAQARVGDIGHCPSDSHGALCCAHDVQGPCVDGSPNVFINGMPATRLGDPGVHSSCCGANEWVAGAGSMSVFINGIASHRLGDMTRHCGGTGKTITGSENVFTGG